MPHHFPTSYLYTKWDGSEDASLGPDDVFDALSEDLLRDGDLDLALRKAFRWGMQGSDGMPREGLRDLIERLRKQRQELLDTYNFDSVLGDIPERLQEIIDRERSTLDDRLDRRQQSENVSGEDQEALRDFLNQKRDKLDSLPDDASSQITELQKYDFVDRTAGEEFEKLLDELRQQITDALFNNIMGSAGQGQDGPGGDMKDFLKDLNEAFDQQKAGQPVDMDRLNNKWGHMFGGRADNLDQIAERMRSRMAAAQTLMRLLSPQQRAEVQAMMEQSMQDAGIEDELRQLQEHLGAISPPSMEQSQTHGQEEIPLDMALQALEQAAEIEQVESALREMAGPDDLQGIPPEMLKSVLSEQDREWLDNWNSMRDQLIEHGYAVEGRRGLELTPRAIRKIGEQALKDIFSSLKDLGPGEHDIRDRGSAGESAESSAPWQFGDPFLLDLPRTVMNGIRGRGPGTPVQLRPDDFEVIERESRTSTATALLIDMSRSMYYTGSWDAAKRAALALDTLIRGKYPRDTLELIGFSSTASPLKLTDLPNLEWNEYTYGTNLQHALQLARERLRPERGRNRQIIVITDGEPTAHIENGRAEFNYPPTWQTFEATIREVVACTREQISINVFLLEQSPYMSRFIEDLMRINRGRVMNASPNRLGSYVLKDFLQQRTAERSRH